MVERSALFVSCRVGHGANRLAKGDGQMTETAVRLVIEVRLTLGEWGQQGLSVRQARRLAAEVRSRVRAGRLDTGLTATTSEPRCRAF